MAFVMRHVVGSGLTWVASPSALKQPISRVPIKALQHMSQHTKQPWHLWSMQPTTVTLTLARTWLPSQRPRNIMNGFTEGPGTRLCHASSLYRDLLLACQGLQMLLELSGAVCRPVCKQ